MNGVTALIAVIIIVILMAVYTINMPSNVLAKKYKKSDTMTQSNNCGNGVLPLNIDCQSTASQTQGNDNTASVITSSLVPFP